MLVNDEMLNSTYQIYAVLQYNGSSVASNPLVISVGGVEAGSGSSSASSSGSSSSGGTSSGASLCEVAPARIPGRRWIRKHLQRQRVFCFGWFGQHALWRFFRSRAASEGASSVPSESTAPTGATGDTSSGNGASGNSSAPSGNSKAPAMHRPLRTTKRKP